MAEVLLLYCYVVFQLSLFFRTGSSPLSFIQMALQTRQWTQLPAEECTRIIEALPTICATCLEQGELEETDFDAHKIPEDGIRRSELNSLSRHRALCLNKGANVVKRQKLANRQKGQQVCQQEALAKKKLEKAALKALKAASTERVCNKYMYVSLYCCFPFFF